MAVNLKERFLNNIIVIKTIDRAKNASFPGFAGIAIYDVLALFFEAISKGVVAQRAAAISYNFFMAVFPSLLLFISLIPIIPIEGFQKELTDLMLELMPANTNNGIISVIDEIINKPKNGIVSIGFVLSIWFATNGFKSMIIAFNSSVHIGKKRTFFSLNKTAFVLLFVFIIATVVTVSGFVFDEFVIGFLVEKGLLVKGISYYLLLIADWILRIAMLFFIISFFYWYAPNYDKRFRLISLGSLFTTIVIILVTFLFNIYISNFAKYNVLYGSIATLIIVMVWIYINSFILLIGFEINTSIVQAKYEDEEKKQALLGARKRPVKDLINKVLKDLSEK